MGELRQIPRQTSSSGAEQLCSQKFGEVARVLWPQKTAFELAALTGTSERCARYWLAGERQPSTAAIRAVLNEILS